MTYQEKVLRYRVSYRDLFIEKRMAAGRTDATPAVPNYYLEYSTNDLDDAVAFMKREAAEWGTEDRLYRITDNGSESFITRSEIF